ncbi:HAD family hydrolase [Streptomyces aidingensis]|uniref:Haloacid dehalogenase superfamily, subfamily IA, variant 3 with third motif having DD or ED n=1 Tax=Streptomyces aidingensis TaxID=910347 RepID=A0A1I1K6D5_9ACTN|nr:HAD family phosphatase [Streptomyces aidingensis]SFC56537.1 haloacid dehalogenase superfamily, subfamily IA, variant 3 with third motif having DD or ED [Streptomyces aidingensis]
MTSPFRFFGNWSPAAVVCDVDGTLVDTERSWQEARIRTLADYGLKPPAGFPERVEGMHYTDCGRLMAVEASKPELAGELADALLRHFLARAGDDAVAMPGAADFVHRVARRVPLAAASNCPAEAVRAGLERAGLLHHMRHVVVAGMRVPGGSGATVRPKPWPDAYATAARLCGAAPELVLAVEDSRTGARAAREAGLRVLGVGSRLAGDGNGTGNGGGGSGGGSGGDGAVDAWVASLDDPALLAWAGGLRPAASRSRGAPTAR